MMPLDLQALSSWRLNRYAYDDVAFVSLRPCCLDFIPERLL
jgi:hypothetical protein